MRMFAMEQELLTLASELMYRSYFFNSTGNRVETIIFFICGNEYRVDTYMCDGGLASVVCIIIRYNCPLREWHNLDPTIL